MSLPDIWPDSELGAPIADGFEAAYVWQNLGLCAANCWPLGSPEAAMWQCAFAQGLAVGPEFWPGVFAAHEGLGVH